MDSLAVEEQIWLPSVIVGIDFGMTCTGVAYSSEESGWARPQVIQQWPNSTYALFSKYPSRVGYNRFGQAVDWGTCSLSQEVSNQEREFKLYLDSAFGDESEHGLSHDKAVKIYIDYMKALNKHIEKTLMGRLPRWNERNVEFRFSTPTTWKNPRIINQLKVWLAEAGFVNTSRRRMVFLRTEAEAAAVYVAEMSREQESLQEGNVAMVLDAGGATSDLTILEIVERTPDIIRMRELEKSEGMNIGSVMIDVAARKLVEEKLQHMHVHASIGLKWLAQQMLEEARFVHFKCNYGNDDFLLNFRMKVPGRPGKHVILTSSDIQGFFEPLVQDLINNINDKLTSLARSNPQHQLRYLVLSGGLGSSEYIKQRLTAEFSNSPSRPANARNLRVLVTPEPQLAVVKGLVMDRSQTLNQGTSVWAGRCCRSSYGILCKDTYDGRKHFGERVVKDPVTGNLCVEDQIDWIIKEGEPIPEEGKLKPYHLKVTQEKRLEPFRAHVVMSELPATDLPRSRQRGPVTRLCTVEGRFQPEDFMTNDFVKVKKRFFSKQNEHDVAHFYLKIIVGSTDLEFEFVSQSGRKYGETSSKVKVIWNDVQPGPQSPYTSVSDDIGIFPNIAEI